MQSFFPRLTSAIAIITVSICFATAEDTPQFEIDMIYPRNETYNVTDTLPIVLAIQNISAVEALGEYEVYFYIMPYGHGVTPGGISFDGGSLINMNRTDGAAIFVGNTNVSD
ncbi:hypothetical protein F5Y15DRAFT_415556 [Xylariaceae sp. FL0016]|nr:hypothetical protein F5Y15DRAFT_415556 [Xylariaceae sp. FL0016]